MFLALVDKYESYIKAFELKLREFQSESDSAKKALADERQKLELQLTAAIRDRDSAIADCEKVIPCYRYLIFTYLY